MRSGPRCRSNPVAVVMAGRLVIAMARARAGDGPAAIAEAPSLGSPAVTSAALRGISEALLGVDLPGRPGSPRRP
jgi:hypothetical protein